MLLSHLAMPEPREVQWVGMTECGYVVASPPRPVAGRETSPSCCQREVRTLALAARRRALLSLRNWPTQFPIESYPLLTIKHLGIVRHRPTLLLPFAA
jgi:hypothetical protein